MDKFKTTFDMKKYFTLILLVAVFISCEKDEFSIAENLYGKWEVLRLEPNGLFKNNILPDEFSPRVTFYEDGSLGLSLSRNGCGGEFSISDINELDISMTFCTEVCCDDDFSKQCANLFEQVTSFEIKNKNSLELNIKGWGNIRLNRLD